MKGNLSWLKEINTPGIEVKKIEVLIWILMASLFTILLSLGDSNGIGIYQQPDHNLLFPLVIGSIVNGCIIYVLGIRVIPYYYLKRKSLRLFITLLVLFILAIAVKTTFDLLQIHSIYPDLKHYPFLVLIEDNLYFCIPVFVFGILFGIYKSLIYQSQHPTNKLMAIPSGKKSFRFKTEDIDYFEAQGNYVKVVGKFKSELLYISLAKLEKQADPRYFTRVHRSYIVSIRNASYIDSRKVLIGDREIPVGSKYQKKIKSFLSDKAN